MRNDLKKIEKICAHCEHAVIIRESDVCVCGEHGVVRASDNCRAFKPDLLKVTPHVRKLPDGDYDATVFLDI